MLQLYNKNLANAITNQEIKLIRIETIQVNLNNQQLKIKNIQYIFNITLNLLSQSLLEEQEFDLELISRADSQKQFKLTDSQDQIFHAIKTDTRVYKIAEIKSKSKSKSDSTATTPSSNSPAAIKSIYKTMAVWHY